MDRSYKTTVDSGNRRPPYKSCLQRSGFQKTHQDISSSKSCPTLEGTPDTKISRFFLMCNSLHLSTISYLKNNQNIKRITTTHVKANLSSDRKCEVKVSEFLAEKCHHC